MQEFSTPMMKQYQSIKEQYSDCFLFFRLGDFYELFCEDAVKGAPLLNITLTRRPRGKDGDIPMAGVPYHSSDIYIAKLVKQGHKVAICEQVSDPTGKGIVEREVVRIITPGTILDENTLNRKEHNYIMSISFGIDCLGIAVVDLSTGDFQSTQICVEDNMESIIQTEIARFNPSECILSQASYKDSKIMKLLACEHGLNVYCFDEWEVYADDAEKKLKKHFKVNSLQGFGLNRNKEAQIASSALLGYLKSTQKGNVYHIKKIVSYSRNDYVILDRSTTMNLELFSTLVNQEKNGSFIEVIDFTKTAMGGRLLRTWVKKPLIRKKDIELRLNAVEFFLKNVILRKDIVEELNKIYDIPRLISRLSVGIGNAHDLLNLRQSLLSVKIIKNILKKTDSKLVEKIRNDISKDIDNIIKVIENNIAEDPPIDLKKGGLIKNGVNSDLDELRDKVGGGKAWIAKIESRERERTGINTLKVKFNRVFGYYIEVSKANLHLAPDDYLRKQTMTNAERFFTPELKKYEEKILAGEETINALENQLFMDLLKKVLEYVDILQIVTQSVASIDCLISLAILAEKKNYIKPQINTKGEINILSGRHPVVEEILREKQFVPNDVILNHESEQLLIITGPNMAGKSVFMRQTALIVLMAHIGSFVSAEKADISLVDRIFVRSGASDIISSGLSTFMVEMVETAHILNHATPKSLIIMDEIGRGTSTYDGISIAWAVAEYIVNNARLSAKTLFATHYHELQILEDDYPEKVKNYNIAVENNEGDDPIFLHKVIRGRASHSYAVAVARLAGVPKEITQKADKILESMENKSRDTFVWEGNKKKGMKSEVNEKADKKIIKELKNIKLEEMTPLEAMNELEKIKKKYCE